MGRAGVASLVLDRLAAYCSEKADSRQAWPAFLITRKDLRALSKDRECGDKTIVLIVLFGGGPGAGVTQR